MTALGGAKEVHAPRKQPTDKPIYVAHTAEALGVVWASEPRPHELPLRRPAKRNHHQAFVVGCADCFGEIAFVFDVPQPFSFVSETVSRVRSCPAVPCGGLQDAGAATRGSGAAELVLPEPEFALNSRVSSRPPLRSFAPPARCWC